MTQTYVIYFTLKKKFNFFLFFLVYIINLFIFATYLKIKNLWKQN
jgi:hypothetical protein